MSELDNKITQQMGSELNQGVSKGTGFLSRASRSLFNASKKAVKIANKVAKKLSDKTLGQLLLALPLPIKIAILSISILFFIIICIENENPDAISSYENYKKGVEQTSGNYSDYVEEKKNVNITSSVESSSTNTSVAETTGFNHSDFADGETTVSDEAVGDLEYDGENAITSEIGLICNDYIAFFKNLFTYVYENLCNNEVERVINEREYNISECKQNYLNQREEYMNYINYAELICVMSQNEQLSYENSTIESIKSYLEKDENNEKLQNLFSIYAEEKIGYYTIDSSVTTESEEVKSTYYQNRVGETISEKDYFNAYAQVTNFSEIMSRFFVGNDFDENAFEEYCDTHQDEVFEDVTEGYVANGRTVVKICGDTPKFKKRVYVSNQYLEKINDNNYVYVTKEEYRDKYAGYYSLCKDGRLVDIHNGEFVTEGSSHYELVTEYTTEWIWEYKYADFTLIPYCLKDLFQCFGIEENEYNVSHPTVTNLNVLEEQEEMLRWRASDIDFGKSTRTEMETPYETLLSGLTSEESTSLYNSLRTQLTLSGDWQTDIYNSCCSLKNILYSSSFNSSASGNYYSTFVCCTYVYEAFERIGIDICPVTLTQEDQTRLGGNASGRQLWKSCTLMAYYFRHYQPQACFYTKNISEWQVGDIIFLQYDVKKSAMVYNTEYISKTSNGGNGEYSDHVFIYLGNGIMGEEAGGSLKKSTIKNVPTKYINATWLVVRPSLLN